MFYKNLVFMKVFGHEILFNDIGVPPDSPFLKINLVKFVRNMSRRGTPHNPSIGY